MEMDRETGEIVPNGRSNSQRAMPPREAPEPNYGGLRLEQALQYIQAELPHWIKAEKAGAHKIKYAPLKDILEAVRPICNKYGVRIRQGAERSWPLDEGGGSKGRLIPVYTELVHAGSGERERTVIEIPLMKFDPQAMGSSITYGRRYTLLAGLGLASDEADDDGVAARRADLTGEVSESALLSQLKAEIDKVKEVTSLLVWGEEPKNKRRVDDLSEGELVLLRQHWTKRKQDLIAEAAQA
jgi:hypothetical protein